MLRYMSTNGSAETKNAWNCMEKRSKVPIWKNNLQILPAVINILAIRVATMILQKNFGGCQ